MPQAVGGFIGGLVLGAFNVLTAVGFSGAAANLIIDVGIKLAGLALLGKVVNKFTKVPDLAQSAQAQQLVVRGTIEHQRIIYGEVLVGGTLVYLNSAGSHNQSLYHVMALAGHEIEDITDVWLDDIEIPSAAIDWAGDGSVDSGDFRGNLSANPAVYLDKKLGTDTQTHPADLVAAFAEWTADHDGRGIAYGYSRFDYFEGQTDVWSGGAPNQIRWLVKGKKVYDPRSDSTQSFGTGPHRLASSGTWEYSSNPALCWADYLIDADLGMGLATTKIDYGYVASAAEICDGVVALPTVADPTTDVRYACNGVLFTGDVHEININKILSSFNGSQARINGLWKVRAFGYETPTLQYNEDHIVGDIQLSLDPDESDRYNTVRGTFIDRDRLWQPQQFPEFTAAEYVTRDGGNVIYEDIQLPMTTNIYMAQRLAAGILELGDLTRRAVAPMNFNALAAEIGGTIKLSLDKMEWTDKEFRVVNYALQDMQGISLTLREEAAASYVDVATNEYTISSQGSYITANPGVPAPNSLYVTNLPQGVRLNWVNPPARLFDAIEVHRSHVNSFESVVTSQINESFANYYIDQPPQNRVWYYWIRARNYAGEVSSQYPINSSYEGVWGDDGSYIIMHDGSFEQSPIDTFSDLAETFWTPVETTTHGSSTGGKSHFVVKSSGLGTGESHHLQWGAIMNGSYNGPMIHSIFNTKRVPVLRGAAIALNARYRVTSYTNVQSLFVWFELNGHKSLHSAGASEIFGVGPTPTNSVDWDIFSYYLEVQSWTNVQSYGFVSGEIQFNMYGDNTEANSQYANVEVDWFHMRWVTP